MMCDMHDSFLSFHPSPTPGVIEDLMGDSFQASHATLGAQGMLGNGRTQIPRRTFYWKKINPFRRDEKTHLQEMT